MLLRLTVIDARTGGERPLEVRAEEQHTVGDLLAELGVASGTRVHVDGSLLPLETPIGAPPVLDGGLLLLGRPGPHAVPGPVSLLRLATVAGPDAGRSLDVVRGVHVVGRGETASLRLEDDALSREHLELAVDRDGVLVRDLGTTNGTLMDGQPLPTDGRRLRVGTPVRAGRTTFLLEARRTPPSRRRPTGAGTLAVNPTPHLPGPSAAATIHLPEEPRRPRARRIPWIMVAAPLPVAGLLALFLGPRMLLIGLLSPLMVVASTLADRSNSRREHREAHARWRTETTRCGRRLTAALAAERRARTRAAPDPMALLDAARGDDTRLWQRRPGDEDYLDLRMGLGPAEARTTVEGRPGSREHPVIDDVPLVVDLAEVGVLGIAGPRTDRDRLARQLLGQLTVLHSHHDLRLSVVAEDEGWWSPFARLVHLREHDDVPGSARTAVDVGAATAILAGHAALVRERAETARETRTAGSGRPVDLVLVVDGVGRWRTDPNLRTVLADRGAHGVHVIALAETAEGLPHETGAVLLLVGADGRVRISGEEAASCTLDLVGPGWARRVAGALAPLRDATPSAKGGGLPTTTRLADLTDLDPDDVEGIRRRWARERPGPVDLSVVVGAAADGDHRIDLRRDGPHALVAGTTGSGKSEFLQSWVTALALHLSPEEITFVLVDYKGGSAFADCAHLPHTVGLLTDLDPEQATRALSSLDAELTRREHILAASGAKDIDAHRGEPLPRLMIVIDEFRMLAEEQPEALAHFMRIAAVGRSLGVHLVLATQRPGGIVSADVKANVNLRIALRVRDRVDSEDVLGCRDAAALPEEAPGRALARTGGSPPQAFQTGRVAGHATSTARALLVRSPGGPWPSPPPMAETGPTDLQRIAASLTRAATDLGIARPHQPWLPPLPETLTPEDVTAHDPDGGGPGAPFGLLDLPAEQRQAPLQWSPTGGHWMIVGGPATGRTTALASLITATARTWGADEVQIQVVGDGSAGIAALAPLPHVGSIVDSEDLPVMRRFLARLEDDVRQRRALLRGEGHPTLEAWWAAHHAGEGARVPPPHVVVAVDGWGRATRPGGGPGIVETADVLETLVRDGASAGVRLVVTGGRELLSGRIGSLIGTRLVLHLPDRGDAALAGLGRGEGSTRSVPGRGHLQPAGHVAQVALPSPVAADAGHPDGPPGTATALPWVVAPLPAEVTIGDLPSAIDREVAIGLGGSGHEVVGWPTAGARRFLVCGPAGSGRSTALATIAEALSVHGAPVVVLGEGGALTPGCRRMTGEDREELLALRQRHPDLVVVVDDLDRLEEAPVADVLREITRRVDADRGLVVAATSTHASTAVRGLVADVARGRAGILLQPTARGDGDAFGLRVPALERAPGRGHLIVDGRAREVQVALPPAATPSA